MRPAAGAEINGFWRYILEQQISACGQSRQVTERYGY